MRSRFWLRVAPAVVVAAWVAGCSSSPAPQSAPTPPAQTLPARPETDDTFVSGAEDSVGSLPGSPDAAFRYRFKQIDPASDHFTFQDRDLSFYFKPTPDALHFQVENRQNRPVWIDWERSVFYDPRGTSGKLAHSTTHWVDRFQAQSSTQIAGLQRYTGDYLLPLEYLVDPAGSLQQIHRPLFPEDQTAATYADREFGVDLMFVIEDRPRVYPFRFRVASVIAR